MSQDSTYLDFMYEDRMYLSSGFSYSFVMKEITVYIEADDSYLTVDELCFNVQNIWKKYFYWEKIEQFFVEYYNEVILNKNIESKKQKLKKHYLECLRKSNTQEERYNELIITTWMEAKKYLYWWKYSQNIIFDARFCSAEEILEAYDLAVEMWYNPRIEANFTTVIKTASENSMPEEREKLKKVHEKYLWELLKLYKLRPKLKIKLIFFSYDSILYALLIPKRYAKKFLEVMIKQEDFEDGLVRSFKNKWENQNKKIKLNN